MVDWVAEPFASPFMRNAVAAGLLAALTCALVGTWVVLRGQTFLGDAIAHGVLPGVGAALALGASTTLGALTGALGMAAAVAVLGRGGRVRDDVAIGVAFAAMLALGVLIVSRAGTGGDLSSFLFGSIAGVTGTDLLTQAVFAASVLATLIVLHRPLTALAFDPAKAEALGMRPERTRAAQLVLVAVAVVVSFQVVGALLVFSLLTAPAAAASLLVKRIPTVMAVAVLFGGVAVTVGLLVSWHADTAIGATIALVATAEFLVALVARSGARALARRRGARRCGFAGTCLIGALVLATACGSDPAPAGGRTGSDPVRVATTSELFADLVRRVTGDAAEVGTLIPPGRDPHAYEPPPSAARIVARADLVVSNGLLLETRALTGLIEANLRRGGRHLVLAEAAAETGARPRELVEDVPLEVPWLGVEADADPRGYDPPVVELRLRRVQGPGRFSAYVAGTLGDPEIYFRTDDGIGGDRMAVPLGAHTHLNWAFDAPGRWDVEVAAVHVARDGTATEQARATLRFLVGTPPDSRSGATVVDGGHLDVAFRAPRRRPGAPAAGRLLLVHEELGDLDPARTWIVVPDAARDEVPDDPRYAFLGAPGSPLWVLPQAVAGKHTHGRLDPHLWLDPAYARRYVQVITDALVEVDPARAARYRRRGAATVAELRRLDDRVRAQLAGIPPERRRIISTHDAFGYLAAAYGFEVSGFVAPTPGQEPSAAAVARLERAIRSLPVPVVFQEPNYRRQNDLLARIAARNGASVCTLYGETFDHRVRSYPALVEHNARELRRCLGGDGAATGPAPETREDP